MSDQNHTTSAEFREIDRFPGYRFGSDGSCWTRWKSARCPDGGRGAIGVIGTDWKRMNGHVQRNGYCYIELRLLGGGKRVMCRLHRLILEAFTGPCPSGMECCHLDGSRADNRVDNLRWASHADNIADKKQHGTAQVGSKHPSAKLTEEQVIEIRKQFAAGVMVKELAQTYGVDRNTIARAAYGLGWTEVPGSDPIPRPGAGRKLNPSQVAEIRQLREGGMIHREIALRYGISRSHVGEICSKKTWVS